MEKSPQSPNLGEFFQLLPSYFQKNKTEKTLTYYFAIEEEEWTVTISPDLCLVEEGKAIEQPDCYLQTTKDILIRTYKGEYIPSFADLMSGKIKTNRPDLLLLFRGVFSQE